MTRFETHFCMMKSLPSFFHSLLQVIVCAASCGAKGFGAFIVPCPPHWSGDLETVSRNRFVEDLGKRNVDMVNARYGDIRCNYSPKHSKYPGIAIIAIYPLAEGNRFSFYLTKAPVTCKEP